MLRQSGKEGRREGGREEGGKVREEQEGRWGGEGEREKVTKC